MITVDLEPTRILLAASWACLMLIYLLGDVIRIYAGHAEPGKIDGKETAGWMWTLIAVIMMIPIVMILVSLLVPAAPLKWIAIIVSIGFVLFNLAGLPYKGAYDNLLLIVSFALNAYIVWLAWTWNPGA